MLNETISENCNEADFASLVSSAEIRFYNPPISALQSEGTINVVSAQDVVRRQELIERLRQLPREALGHIRHFQTQIGCLNRCSFCSQSAGTTIWNMPRQDLANLVAALKTVGLEQALEDGLIASNPLTSTGVYSQSFAMPVNGLIGAGRNDRPGVIYCYLDNDPASYPHLDDLIQWLHEDLGVSVRIATVGYSRKNDEITRMHNRISNQLMSGVAGLRLSFSPYTYGWTSAAERIGVASRDDFEQDVAHLLSTYKSTFLSEKKGRKGACVELRFKPLVMQQTVHTELIQGHLIIKSGSYLVVQQEPKGLAEVSHICNPRNHGTELSLPGDVSWLIRGNPAELEADWRLLVNKLLSGDDLEWPFTNKTSLLHRLENEDGQYFGVDVQRDERGVFSKFFYPDTPLRPGPGCIDGERYHLNALIEARETQQNQDWDHVDQLLSRLDGQAASLQGIDEKACRYIREQIIELVSSYVRTLKFAGYPSSAFFDRELTVDTGHICNLGRAFHEYKAIASRPNLPLTPNHERAFGLTGEMAEEGVAWRLAVAPLQRTAPSSSARGERNSYREEPSILIEKLDLSMTATSHGQSRARHFIRTHAIDRITARDTKAFPLIPGHHAEHKK